MSYAMDFPIAANAHAEARAAFIRKTYGHLAGAILAFVALEALMINVFPSVGESIARAMLSGSWLIVLLAFMGVSWLADYWARSATSLALQYAGLGLYVVAEALIFLPLLYIAAHFANPNIIPTAGIFTLAIFGGLTAAVFITGKDFSHIGPYLCMGGFLAIGLVVAAIVFGFSLGLWFSFAMVALASGYILYDTSNVLHHYRTDQYVAAALALFASVALLFYYILRILMASSNRN